MEQPAIDLEKENPSPQQDESVIPEARHAYSRSMLHLFVYWALSIVLVLVIRKLLPDSLAKNQAVLYLSNFLPMYLIAFPLYLLLSKTLPVTLPTDGLKMKPHHFLLAFLASEALAIAGNLIGVIINVILTLVSGVQTASTFLQDGILGQYSLLLIFFAVCCAPVIEEFLFRKILIDRVRKYGTGTAMLMSGIMFGLFHGNFSQFFYAALLGIFFAYIYIRTGKIIYTIIMHMMLNTWGSFVPLLFLRTLDTEKLMDALTSQDFSQLAAMLPDLMPFIGFTVCTYMIALAGLVLLILNKDKFKLPPAEKPIPKGKRAKTAFLNVGTLLFIAACIAEFVIQISDNL